MATYPGSVYAPASKAAGNTIQASFFNDPDAEITAIEDALKNGVQHAITIATGGLTISTGGLRVSGGSTLAQLQAGASTLDTLVVGQLQAGNSTVADLRVTGTLTVVGSILATVPAVRVTHSATQNVNASAWTGLNWDTIDVDTAGMHSTSVNSSRLTFAASSGVYVVGCSVEWPVNASNQRFLRLMVNDVTSAGATATSSMTSVIIPQSLSAMVRAASTTDYVTVQVFQNTASSMLLNANSTTYGVSFWAHRVTG